MTVLAILCFFLFIATLIEHAISGTWNAKYFKKGICIYNKIVKIKKVQDIESLNSRLIQYSKSEKNIECFRYRQIDKENIAFREKQFSFNDFGVRYSPIMHGNIYINNNKSEITITGLLNWFFILFLICWYLFVAIFIRTSLIGLPMIFLVVLFLVGPFVFLAIIYLVQKNKYDSITEYIEINS